MRARWLGATGIKVPEIAIEGEDLELLGENRVRVGEVEIEALVLSGPADTDALHESHARGIPVIVRADEAEAVAAALERPEVSCVLVPGDRADLRELDLRRLKYG